MVSKKDALKYEALQEPMLNIYLGLEYEMLMNIADTLAANKDLLKDDAALWKMQKLHELGMLERRNLALIRKTADITSAQLNQIIIQAGLMGNEENENLLQEAVAEGATPIVPPPVQDSPQITNIMLAAQNNAKSVINLTNSTMLEGSKQIYKDIINSAFVNMAAGNITHDVALRRAVSEWTANGVPALVDRRGRRWGTEGYVRTVLTSTMGNVTNQMQDTRIEEAGVELVEVSSHSGARPKCAPYQGRIFTIKEGNTKYKHLYKDTSYGDPAGLFGVNCGHRKYPFIPGFSEQRYKPYNEKENEKAYKESQKQREIERSIRKAKTEQDFLTKLGDTEGAAKAAEKVKAQQARMRNFIEQTGRTRRRNREQIITSSKAKDYINNSNKTVAAQNKYIDKTSKEIQKKINEVNAKPKTKTNIKPDKAIMKPEKADIPKQSESEAVTIQRRTAAANAVDAANAADMIVKSQATKETAERTVKALSREFDADEPVFFWDELEQAFAEAKIVGKFGKNKDKYKVLDEFGEEFILEPDALVNKNKVGMDVLEFNKFKKDAKKAYTDKKIGEVAKERKKSKKEVPDVSKGVKAEDVANIAAREKDFYKIPDPKKPPKFFEDEIRRIVELQSTDPISTDALKLYSTNAYTAINNYKRGIWDKDMAQMMLGDLGKITQIADIDKAFEKHAKPLDKDYVFYRHMQEDFLDVAFDGETLAQIKRLKKKIHDEYDTAEEAAAEIAELNKLIVNTTIQDKSYVSTSYQDDIFTRYQGVELKILAPEGYSNGIFLEGISAFGNQAGAGNEREFLINAGQKFQIVRVDMDLAIDENIVFVVVPVM